MLMQLITYVANDGDLKGQFCTNVSENHLSHPHKAEEELVSLESMDVSNLSKSQHEHVNDLIGDAMEESEEIKQKEGKILIFKKIYKLRTFPYIGRNSFLQKDKLRRVML